MNTVGDIVRQVASMVGCKFVATTYETKGTGEVQDVTIAMGFSVENMYKRDLVVLNRMIPTLSGIDLVAANELRASREESLREGIGNNSRYTQADTWIVVPGLKGIKIHKETGSVNVSGLLVRKTVIRPGTYKVVKSSDKTLAKKAISRQLPSNRYRSYSLENVETMRLNGDTLSIQTL